MEEKVEQEGDFKMKKPKQLGDVKQIDNVKVDLSKQPEEVKDDVKVTITEPNTEKPKEEVVTEPEGLLEEIKTPEVSNTEVEEPQPVNELPESVGNLVNFMKETGGTVEDYVRLNTDYSNVDNDILLKEYYKNTKPHLSMDEIEYILEDSFAFDEDVDDERVVKKRQIALKEEVVKAKEFLEGVKDKYYQEIKLKPGTTKHQQEATEFFNNYKKQQDLAKQKHEQFKDKTKQFFNNDFKGFEFNVGEKNFNYTVNNPQNIADAQSDISKFIKKFLNEDGTIKDHAGYHKAIYAARNSDNLAKHFYEQGKADAAKDMLAQSKNITTDDRPRAGGDVYVGGLKVKAITGGDGSKLKIKRRTK